MRDRTQLQLSIELGSEPIRGSLQRLPEEPRSFTGWIELAAAIEEARTRVNGDGHTAAADPSSNGRQTDEKTRVEPWGEG